MFMTDPLLRFIHISDTHIHPDPEYTKDYSDATTYDGALALVKAVNDLPFTPDFILHTGDVAYDPDPEAYTVCMEILSNLKAPLYYVAGNHDDSVALQQQLLGRDEPRRSFHYAFEQNGVQIIVTDSNGPAQPPAGYVDDYQLEWISGLCQAQDDRPLVIAIHHNPLVVGIPWLDDYMGIQNGDMFHDAIFPARHRIRGVFFGHVHQNLDMMRDGILYCSTLSSWTQFQAYPGMTHTTSDSGAEPGFSVVTISQNQTFIRRYRFPLPKL
jgi:Icc protein